MHPGSAKGIMVNAGAVGCEIQMMLPVEETPEQTEGYEGFYHLIKISGSCERAELIYIVRDHDADKFAQKQQKLKEIADVMNQKYGEERLIFRSKNNIETWQRRSVLVII